MGGTRKLEGGTRKLEGKKNYWRHMNVGAARIFGRQLRNVEANFLGTIKRSFLGIYDSWQAIRIHHINFTAFGLVISREKIPQ